MAAEENNPVIYYKQQGQKDESGFLEENDFALIIMTNYQKEILKKYGTDKICVDGTHGLNPYDFILHSLLVVDDMGSGSPVAFCFSNRSHEGIFHLYFSKIKDEVGNVSSKVFMSDDAPAYYNAWEKVMGQVQHRLLCSWHVTRNWCENLAKIKSPEKKKIVFKTIKTIRDELSIGTFHEMLQKLIKDLAEDEDTQNFGKYFNEKYVNRPEVWAYCFRQRLGINTNMFLESLHKKIKYHYLDGKVVKRLDLAINALLQLVRDNIFDRLIKLTKNIPSEKVKRINKSHQEGLSIPNSYMCDKTNLCWNVKSSVDEEHTYEVVKVAETPDVHCCNFRCEQCKICIHTYTCTCPDNVVRYNICKHIHAVAMGHVSEDYVENASDGHALKKMEILANIQSLPEMETFQSNKSTFINKLHTLMETYNSSSITKEEEEELHKHADRCLAVFSKRRPKEAAKSNKRKIQPQSSLFSTKKKRKQNNLVKNPTWRETKFIKKHLLQETNESINIHTEFDHTYSVLK